MKHSRPRAAAAAVALSLSLLVWNDPAVAQQPLATHSLEATPSDVILRHSGRQPAEPWGEYFGQEVVTADFDGDGRTDIAVSATGDSIAGDSSARRGLVYIYFGRGDAFPVLVDRADESADCVLAGTEPFCWFGTELAAGDFDGDGLDDLAVSEDDLKGVHRGRVYVFSGSRIRSSQSIVAGAGEFDTRMTGRGAGRSGYNLNFGFSLTTGDLNGDGLSDLVIGAFGGDGVLGRAVQTGEVAIFLGRRAGWPRDFTADPHTADLYIPGRFGYHQFGNEVIAGDLDGDGRDDLAIAGWGGRGPSNDRPSAGDISIYGFAPGSPVTLPSSTDTLTQPLARIWPQGPLGLIHGATINDRIAASASTEGGKGFAVADYDGDGVRDLVVGAPFIGPAAPNGHNSGGVYVVYGGPALTSGAVIDLASTGSGLSAAATLIGTGESGSSLGDSVRAADLNGDGRAEIITGAPDAADGFGYVALFGGRSRTRTTPAAPTPLLAQPDTLVRGYGQPWRVGEETFVVDATFAGTSFVGIGSPKGGSRPNGGGRGDAGQLDLLDAAEVAASVPRQPFISGLPTTATVRPGNSLELPMSIGGGTGTIVSVALVDAPGFAQVVGATGSSPKLVLTPQLTDRGLFDLQLLVTDSAGATGARRVRVAAGFTPAITSIRSKSLGGAKAKLVISGGGFSKGDAVVEVDGVPVGQVKYPSKYEGDGGQTVSRLIVKTSLVRAGSVVVVKNPREGLSSNAVAVE